MLLSFAFRRRVLRRSRAVWKGYFRGKAACCPICPSRRILEGWASITETTVEDGNADDIAYPPLPWIGARFKSDIRDLNGNKVLAKTLDNPFFSAPRYSLATRPPKTTPSRPTS